MQSYSQRLHLTSAGVLLGLLALAAAASGATDPEAPAADAAAPPAATAGGASAAAAGETADPEPAAAPASAAAAPEAADSASRTLDGSVQALKRDVQALNRDLFLLEEELLFPASTQVAVFLSMDVGELFALDAVELKLDDKEVAHYLYTEREVDALHRGGVHRLYTGNLKAGEHELVALFTGKGPHDREYKRGATVSFEKTLGPKFVELRISDSERARQPEFAVREWE